MMSTDRIAAELTRVQDEYARRTVAMECSRLQDYYYAQLTKAVAEILVTIRGCSVLDIGCGDGTWLKLFHDLGAEKLAGIELRKGPYTAAARNLPEAELVCGSAHQLPWPDAHFDVVSQFVVFTSILDWELRQRIAAEMLRVVKPSGVILWYDFRVNNPCNPNVRGVGKGEIAALFPFAELQLRSLILAPPLARVIVPRSPSLASALERIPFLRTHYLGVIKPVRNARADVSY